MSAYLIGTDVLGDDVLGDMGTGSAPSAPFDRSWQRASTAEFGPGAGGTLYTDPAIIREVQKVLVAKGHRLTVDGVFGPATEEALFAATGVHGPPNDTVLAQLGVSPRPQQSPLATAYAQLFRPPPSSPAPRPPGQPSWLSLPAWEGAPFKRWQAGLAGLGVAAFVTGIVAAIRR